MRILVKSALTGVMLFGLTVAAWAVAGEYGNLCAEGLALGKDIKTDCSVNAVIDGKTYCFGNETAKTLFMKDVHGNSPRLRPITRASTKATLLCRTILVMAGLLPGHDRCLSAASCHATGFVRSAATRRASVSRVEASARPSTRS